MNLVQHGGKFQLDMTIQDALVLQQNLSKAISDSLIQELGGFIMQVVTVDPQEKIPVGSSLYFCIEKGIKNDD